MDINEIEILPRDQPTPSTKMESESTKPKVGEWFWTRDNAEDKYQLGCVIHIGTNYIKLEGVGNWTVRVHFKDFHALCKLEPNPDEHIAKKANHYRREIDRLTAEVRELTSTLGLAPSALPGGESAVAALAVRNNDDAVNEYKSALVLAKDKTLPELFEQIKKASSGLSRWLSATVIPLKAQAAGLNPLIESINSRIFNVELYAGLTETVERIADGNPAPIGTPVHLFQRRAYMDEECLAEYQCGGMDYKNIAGFDKWLAKPKNRDRILPFPRSLIAFQVRRKEKWREAINISDFFRIIEEKDADKMTFLYMRNGDQMYRLQTTIEFQSKLFPDLDAPEVGTEQVYAKIFCSSVKDIISAGAYDAMVKRETDETNEIERLKKITPKKDWFMKFGHGWVSRDSNNYQPFTPESVYYDDIEKKIQVEIEAHNRLVLVLQGLMDRSPVFHPHPKYQLWKGEDFNAAFKMVYDDSRAITAGERPDFEAFRNMLNASLCAGCVTVGQDDAWQRAEAVKEGHRRDNDWRDKSHYRPERFIPLGNPGPGLIAQVVKYGKKAKKCTFKWERERMAYRNYWNRKSETIPCSIIIPATKLLNITAYKPGMFKQFFNDPRTRADYLKWAPLLLTAEEYHAGNETGKPQRK